MRSIESNEVQTETSTTTTTSPPPPAKIARKSGGSKKAAVKTKSKNSGAAKKAPTKGKVAASSQAQGGTAIDKPFDKLNKIEQKLVAHVHSPEAERSLYTIKDLQKAVGAKTTLPVRNGLRAIVRAGWFEKATRGTYRLTAKARKRSLTKGA